MHIWGPVPGNPNGWTGNWARSHSGHAGGFEIGPRAIRGHAHTHEWSWPNSKSQRDFVLQPGVARHELPRENTQRVPTPTGLRPRPAPGSPGSRNPVGVECLICRRLPNVAPKRFEATLG